MKLDEPHMFLTIDNQNIERIGKGCPETSFKFVGHHLDEFLSWDFHINHIKNKLSKSNYLINSSKISSHFTLGNNFIIVYSNLI